MIKTLQSVTHRKITNEDISNLTIFQVKFGPSESREYENSLELNFSPDTIVYWGDGAVSKSPNVNGRHGYNYDHTYSDEFILKNRIITIICEGYPIYNGNSNHRLRYNPLGSALLYRVKHLSDETKSAFGLFAQAKNLTQIPENIFDNTKIQDFQLCFYSAGIEYIPERLFSAAQADATFARAFADCDNLTESDLIFSGPNASSFKSLNFLFEDCANLNVINANMFQSVSHSPNLIGTFSGCKNIVIPQGIFDNMEEPNLYRTFTNFNLKVNDFLREPPRIPLDLFHHIIYTSTNIFGDSREICSDRERLKFIEAMSSNPDKFTLKFRDGDVPFSNYI